jgi:hypothetical protein
MERPLARLPGSDFGERQNRVLLCSRLDMRQFGASILFADKATQQRSHEIRPS